MSVFQHHVNLEGYIKRFPVSTSIILINTAVLIATIFTGGFTLYGRVMKWGILSYYPVFGGEYYRLVSSIFLHGSFMHYLFNTLFGVGIICAGLEKLIGSWKFLIAYLGSGILASIVIIFLTPNTLTVGASGAIYGVIGVFLYITIYKKHLLSYTDRMYIRNLLIINVIFTLVTPSISQLGHFGGLVAGFGIGFLFFVRDKRQFYYYYE